MNVTEKWVEDGYRMEYGYMTPVFIRIYEEVNPNEPGPEEETVIITVSDDD